MRCQEFLFCDVVDHLTRGYQLSEEASLEGVFIGNSMLGGIGDITVCTRLNRCASVRSTRQLKPQVQ